MTLSRRLCLPLLSAALLLPSATAHAQDPSEPGGWVVSEDGRLFVMTADPAFTPGIVVLDGLPASLAGQSLPDDLLGVASDPPGATGFHVVKQLDRDTVTDPGPGRLPVAAMLGADDDGATFAAAQRNLVLPPPCDGSSADACQDPRIVDALAAAYFDDVPLPFRLDPAGRDLVSTGSLEDPGAIVALAGGASVKTRVKAEPGNDRIAVRGEGAVVPAFDGKLRGFDAHVFEIGGPDSGEIINDLERADHAREVALLRQTTVKKNGTARRELQCPSSGQGVVASHYLFEKLGRGAGSLLGVEGLGDGASVIVTEFRLVECGTPPPTPPFAAVGCVDFGINHSPLGEYPTFFDIYGFIFTLGAPEGAPLMADVVVGGMNAGEPLMLDLQPLDLDTEFTYGAVDPLGESGPQAVDAWFFEGAGGIDSYGPKRIKSFEVAGAGFEPIELKSDIRDITGKAIDVSSSEIVIGNCPPRGDPFTLEALADSAELIFADGFESGDTSAWSHTEP